MRGGILMKECYVNALCGICRKENCDKRINKYEANKKNKLCNGMCHTCSSAIHHQSMILKEPFASMRGLQTCAMYHLQKHNGIKFYGRVGENSNESEIEQAILQVYRCKECSFESVVRSIDKLSGCQKYAADKSGYSLDGIASNLKKVRVCNSLKEVEAGIMHIVPKYLGVCVISQNAGIDVNEICDYLKTVVSDVFFVHELAITPVLFKLLNQKRIAKSMYDKYYVE